MFSLLFFAIQLINQDTILSNFKQSVQILSSDIMMGRSSTRSEIWEAARYIHQQFTEIGLETFSNNSYFQRFNLDNGYEIANVVGYIKSSKNTDKSIIFSAHYDGLGVGEIDITGDSIFNGAVDNAVGVAALIELARIYKNNAAPLVNIVFLATGAEEGGSYGAEAYITNPVFPLKDIRIVLNIDGFNIHGLTEDIFMMPRQGITFTETINVIAKKEYGLINNTPDWADQMNTSFDTKSFLQIGIPALTIWSGSQMKGMTKLESGIHQQKINGGRHHTQNDEMTKLWNYTGVMTHLRIYKSIADFYSNSDVRERVTNKSLFQD